MYARVTRSRVDPSRVDEAEKIAQEIRTALRQLPSFQGIVTAGNYATGEHLSVVVFDTKEHARFTIPWGSDVPARLQALGAQMDEPQFMEVTSFEVAKPL